MLRSEEFDRLRVVLVNTRNPLNIGAAARAVSNFGFFHLRLVNPYEDSYREARSAVGASVVIKNAERYTRLSDAIADCSLVVGTSAIRNRDPQHRVQRLEQAAKLIRRKLRSGHVALLFGSEKVGLSNRDLSHCHFLMNIPTREAHRSMNLGQAVAVCLYELIRDQPVRERKATVELKKMDLAAAGDLERMTILLLDALRTSGYVAPGSAASTEEKVRRMVRRLELRTSDAEIWLGMLRQILWKLQGH